MNETRRVRISFDQFLKRSWPMISVGVVLILGVCVAIGWAAFHGAFRRVTSSGPTEVTPTSTVMTATSSRLLDGVMVDASSSQLLPYAVMVENHPDARPLSGPAKANVAYEFPVEGGITRYVLLFDASSTVDAIGPVRSARPYFVDVADAYRALYAHVGGSPDALTLIAGKQSFKNVDEMKNGPSFWRSTNRVAPHNAYTKTDLLTALAQKKMWSAGSFRPWFYQDDAPLEKTATTTARGTTNGPTITYGGTYNVKWIYDRLTNTYVRNDGGAVQKDQDGATVTAKNVIVIQTDGRVLDDYGRLFIRTTGKGTGTLYRDGISESILWRRADGETYRWEHVDGTDAVLNRGTTWVEVTLSNTSTTTP